MPEPRPTSVIAPERAANICGAFEALEAITGLLGAARWDLARGNIQIMAQHAQSITGHCFQLVRIAGRAEVTAGVESP